MLSTSEQAALAVFRSFMVNTGEMLCFHGPQLEKHGPTLRQLAEKNLVVKEQFAGGYSLTRAGFEAMAGPRPSRSGKAPSGKAPAGKSQSRAVQPVAAPSVKAQSAKAPSGKAKPVAVAAKATATQPRSPASKPARASHSATRR
jgi:hypothetical protein